MAIEFPTHGLDWKAVIRRQQRFCALVTRHWWKDRLCQRQYTYAKEIGIPIFLCVQAGTPLPHDADRYSWRVWETDDELQALVRAVSDGTWHAEA